MANSFGSKGVLKVGTARVRDLSLSRAREGGPRSRAGSRYSLRILLENLLRTRRRRAGHGGRHRGAGRRGIRKAAPDSEIAFMPAPRAAAGLHRRARRRRPGRHARRHEARWAATRRKINPLQPVELVIDHSVQVDEFGTPQALSLQRQHRVRAQPRALRLPALGPEGVRELRASCRPTPASSTRSTSSTWRAWCSPASRDDGRPLAYPDTLVGTDSHTTMINGLGVLGWGVGGIEAEAAMLGQPVSMLIPQVVGFRLTGTLREGATATDLVLTVTEMLRKKGVVGKFVEFFGPGLRGAAARRPRHHRQHGARVRRDLRHLPGRRGDAALPAPHRPPDEQVALVEAYCKEQGLFRTRRTRPKPTTPTRSSSTSPPSSRAWPARSARRTACRCPRCQDVVRGGARRSPAQAEEAPTAATPVARPPAGGGYAVDRRQVAATRRSDHGSVVIAAITSCTNTSNPSVMVGRRPAGQEGGRARAARPSPG